MTILVDASLRCNLNCRYCYNSKNRQREEEIDLPKIVDAINRVHALRKDNQICLHGGEPTVWPKDVLYPLLSLAKELTGESHVQTNAININQEIIQNFKKYNTYLGVSIDGFGRLNRFRAKTDDITEEVMGNLFWLKDEEFNLGIIAVVSKANGLEAERKEMKEFILKLTERNITGRLNPVWINPLDFDIMLSVKELSNFYLDIYDFMMEQGIRGWSPFYDISGRLRGQDRVCVFSGCDPFSTSSGITIDSQGRVTTCRFGSDAWENDLRKTNIRMEVLRATDCKDCPYFYACCGGCPSHSLEWREKTYWCGVFKSLFERESKALKFLDITIGKDIPKQNREHGDIPHGDEHGDHTDSR